MKTSTPDIERIRTAFERNRRALELRPAVGRKTASTRVTMRQGLSCEVEEGPWRLTVDMSDRWGGANAGPNPGVLGRGALGSCLAVSYMLWAARRGIVLSGLEVEVQADFDSRGACGVTAEVPPGYTEVRCIVTVESDASPEQIAALLDEADAHSPYHDVFRRPVSLARELRVRAPQP